MMQFLIRYRLNKIFFILFLFYFATFVLIFTFNIHLFLKEFPSVENLRSLLAFLIFSIFICPFLCLVRFFSFIDIFVVLSEIPGEACKWLAEHTFLNFFSLAVLVGSYMLMLKAWTNTSKLLAFAVTYVFLYQIFW